MEYSRSAGDEDSCGNALAAAIRALSLAPTVSSVMHVVTRTARHLLKADGITFVLREGSDCYYAEEEAIAPLWKGRRFPMQACISGHCMLDREAVAICDVYRDPRIPQTAYRPTFVRSLAMAPVRREDPIAAIGAYWARVREIAPDEVELLQTIADSAALAVANIELEQERRKAREASSELSHRLGNLLSVIGSVARQTARSATSLDAFTATFSSRLDALSRAHLRLRDALPGADLARLVREQLLVGEGDEERIIRSGENVFLGPDEAFELSLVLHELGTNARKYGALSVESGHVHVEWELRTDCGAVTIELLWSETGGPPVKPPAAGGLGTELIRRASKKPGYEAQIAFDPAGLKCRVRMPLAMQLAPVRVESAAAPHAFRTKP